jgi:hypothetical protein
MCLTEQTLPRKEQLHPVLKHRRINIAAGGKHFMGLKDEASFASTCALKG